MFSGLIGTAFSVLIRLELSGPGVQYIADNQLYNSIITAHAIIMSTPLCLVVRPVPKELTNESNCVKSYQSGEVELHEETRTDKLIEKETNGPHTQGLGIVSDLLCITFRITNLIRNVFPN